MQTSNRPALVQTQVPTERMRRVQEFAEWFGISVWTARRMAYDGRVASCKVGKLLYIPDSEIERLTTGGMRQRVAA